LFITLFPVHVPGNRGIKQGERMSEWMCFLYNASLGGSKVIYANTHEICARYVPVENLEQNKFLSPYKNRCRSCEYCGMERSTKAMNYSAEHPEWIPGVIKGSITPDPIKKKIIKSRFELIELR